MAIDKKTVSQDEFSMWRAVFAFALADGKLTIEEQKILSHHIDSVDFSKEQLETLRADMNVKNDVEDLFSKIISPENKKKFCALARSLVWCDGDIAIQEKHILQHVKCFQTREYSEMLKNSAGSDAYKNFVRAYEDTNGFTQIKPAPIFQIAA